MRHKLFVLKNHLQSYDFLGTYKKERSPYLKDLSESNV